MKNSNFIVVVSFLAAVLSSCGSIKPISSEKSTVIIATNVKQSEISDKNRVVVTNLKGESVSNGSTKVDYNEFNEYGFLKNEFSKKRRTLIVSHPYYKSDTIVIQRALRPGVFTLDLLGALTLYLSPSLIIDFSNGNIWKVKKSDREISINLDYGDSYHKMKLLAIDTSIFSNENIKTNNLTAYDRKKEILEENLYWEGKTDLYCYFSGKKIEIPSYDPNLKNSQRKKTIYAIFEWYPNENHRFSNYITATDKTIIPIDVYIDNLGRSCYSYMNDVNGNNKPKFGPLPLLKFDSFENATKWLAGEKIKSLNNPIETQLSAQLKNYIDENPNSPYIELAWNKIYYYEYIALISENDFEKFTVYINRFPKSPYNTQINEAINKYNSIAALTKLNKSDYEYLIKNHIGSANNLQREKEYLKIFFDEGMVVQKNISDLNKLENNMLTLEKLTGCFYSLDDKNKILDEKKRYFSEHLKKNMSYTTFVIDEFKGNSYFTYSEMNLSEKNTYNSTLTKSIFIKDNKFLNGTYIVGNEVYNIKNGLLNGEYKKTDEKGVVLRQGKYEADFKNNTTKAIGEHLFCYGSENYFEKEIITYDKSGKITLFKEFDKDGNDLILKRFNELIEVGDKCLLTKNFNCSVEMYNLVRTTTNGYERFNSSDDFALGELLNKLPKQDDKFPVYYDKKIYDSKIKAVNEEIEAEKQKQIEIEKNKQSNSSSGNKTEGALLKEYLVQLSGGISYDGENYISGFTKNGGCYTRFNGTRGEGAYEIKRIDGNLILRIVTTNNTYEFDAYENLYGKWEFKLKYIDSGNYNLRNTTWKNQQ